MKIGIDLMGGDNIQDIIPAINKYQENYDDKIYAFTTKDNPYLNDLIKSNKIEIIYCESKIEKDDDPAFVIRTKKDSTLVTGGRYLNEKKIDTFVSAGNTGAIVAVGIFVVKRIKGITKPALPGFLPKSKTNTPVMLLDLGANIMATKENMLDYAKISQEYMKNYYKITNPSIKILNIGEEENKGIELYKEVYQELKENKEFNFQGNLEPRDILDADCDIILMEGWTGNIMLKTIEGTVNFFGSNMKKVFYKRFLNKISGLILKKDLKEMYETLDYRKLGGTPVLGIDGLLLKAHGSSDEEAFYNALKQAVNMKKSKFLDNIKTN